VQKNKLGPFRSWLVRALNLNGVPYQSGGWPWWPGGGLESFSGAWQTNVIAAPTTTLLSFSPVYACVTGISQDIAKMRVKLSRNEDGIWEEITEPHGNSTESAVIPLLQNPNPYQDRVKFFESWMLSKLMYGNAYILKHRRGGVITAMHVLHPGCVKPLIAENGDVYYELQRDDLSGIHESTLQKLNERYGRLAIPASEIIHDRMNCLWHKLVGISPLYACNSSATLGGTILNNSTKFFANASRPGGHLTAPGAISDETASRLKTTFEANFGGDNIGKLLVTGDGLTFEAFDPFDAQKAQTKEQIDAAVQDVARAFRYPIWKLSDKAPPYTKPNEAQTMYYTDCLAPHIIAIEECLDNGLGLPIGEVGTEFDLDTLMWMDTGALYESNNAAKGWMKLDEQRRRANLGPLKTGGDTVYLQHQDYSVEALAKRDAKPDPFANTDANGNAKAPDITPAEPKPAEPARGMDRYAAHRLIRGAFPGKLIEC